MSYPDKRFIPIKDDNQSLPSPHRDAVGQHRPSTHRGISNQSRHSVSAGTYNQSTGNKLKDIFFSFEGRITRSTYVVLTVLIMFLSAVAAFLVVSLPSFMKILVVVPLILVLIWSGFAIAVKRLHDRDHIGWWSLLCLIPILNFFLFLYLSLARSNPGANLYGEPGSAAPLPMSVVCYPIFILAVFLNFLPEAIMLPGLNKIPGINYLTPTSYVENPQTVDQAIDNLPKILGERIDTSMRASMAVIKSNGKMLGVGGFITKNRLMVQGLPLLNTIQNELAMQHSLEVTSGENKKARITRFVASDTSITVQKAVFEVDTPIGKPGDFGERNRKILTKMGAFK